MYLSAEEFAFWFYTYILIDIYIYVHLYYFNINLNIKENEELKVIHHALIPNFQDCSGRFRWSCSLSVVRE